MPIHPRPTYRFRKLFLAAMTVLLGLGTLSAQSKTPSEEEIPTAGRLAQFSLLTASPGKRVWSQYGHTGIRYLDPERRTDVVFNYGLFDFSSHNFLLRFLKGQTDYMVGTTLFYNFLLEYQIENRVVTEQVLNLTQTEKDRLLQALITNIKPENREYRYNFFYKNCATMPRDLIEAAIDGKVTYTLETPYRSLRDEVHHFTEAYPWVQFGIDFALGAKADKPASLNVQQFAPEVLMSSFTTAFVTNDSTAKSLILSTKQIIKHIPANDEAPVTNPNPLLVTGLILALTVLLTVLEIALAKPGALKAIFAVWDGVLFGGCGLIGTAIFFLLFFSQHPTTELNYLALWLHPLHIVFALGLLFRSFRKRMASLYKAINLPFQAFALLGVFFLPQALHPAAYPLLIALMIRSLQSGWVVLRKPARHA